MISMYGLKSVNKILRKDQMQTMDVREILDQLAKTKCPLVWSGIEKG